MKRLVVVLLILTPWVMHSMEPETLAKRYLEGKEKELPILPPFISQTIAQELLSKGPIKQFIQSQVFLPFLTCVDCTVHSVKFDSTGDKIITGSEDGPVKIWDAKTGELLHTLRGHTSRVLVFKPVGDKVATGSLDGTVKIWEVTTGNLLTTLQGERGIFMAAVFNSAGDKVITGSHGRTDTAARIWDTMTGRVLHTLDHTGPVFSVVFNPGGDQVATGSFDGAAKIWNTNTGALLHTLHHTGPVFSVAFNAGGDKIAIGSLDGTARIWDAKTGVLLHTLQGQIAQFNPAGDQLITGFEHGPVRIWDVVTGELLHTFQGQTGTFSPAGDKVVTTSKEGVSRLWDIKTGELIQSFEGRGVGEIGSAEFNRAGDKIVALTAKNEPIIRDLGPLLRSEEFLAKDITLRQAVVLNAIFEAMKARGIVKALQEKAFERAPLLRPEEITFDFNKYPHLWDDYKALPEAIKQVFDPYVTTPRAQEQAPLGA